ncbi:fucolectin-6-like isoform X2 [Ornithorhynchus anatinus]|nr:fucolectin-6-like isoform X2 [Ornithorhynchus anatinus]
MLGQFVSVIIPGRIEYLCEVQVLGKPLEDPDPDLALGKSTSRSSTFDSRGDSKNAIDQSPSSSFTRNHCTHTRKDYQPWWRVDLHSRAIVSSVVILNRGDRCQERINGAEIRIGDSELEGGRYNPRCAVISSMGPGEAAGFFRRGMKGRYVSVIVPHRREYLSLCEVQVHGQPGPYVGLNVAMVGTSSQSSTRDSRGLSQKAHDGSSGSHFVKGHCTDTKKEYGPWWMINLKSAFAVSDVAVTNRGDCCAERIKEAEIRVGNSSENGGQGNPRSKFSTW